MNIVFLFDARRVVLSFFIPPRAVQPPCPAPPSSARVALMRANGSASHDCRVMQNKPSARPDGL